MMKLTTFLLVLYSTFAIIASEVHEESRGFLFISPKQIHVGSREKLCLYFKNILDTPADMTLELWTMESRERLASRNYNLTLGSQYETWHCLEDFEIPGTKEKNVEFHLNGTFPLLQDYQVNKKVKVGVRQSDTMRFIETDKDKYKPGQEIRVRVLTLNQNLIPDNTSPHKIWIEDPSGSRMTHWRWKHLKIRNGIIQLTYKLSEEPNMGKWKIVVKEKNQKRYKQHFTVEKYVLPKFSVSINPERPEVSTEDEHFTWNICAQYTYGRPVTGKLEVFLTEWSKTEQVLSLEDFSGCHNFTLDKLQIHAWKGYRNVITINAKIEEGGTGIAVSEDISTTVQENKYVLDFEGLIPSSYKPGLYFDGEFAVKNSQGKRVEEGVQVDVCLTSHMDEGVKKCFTTGTNENGHIKFQLLPLPPHSLEDEVMIGSSWLKVHASVQGSSEIAHAVLTYSPSYSFLEIKLPNGIQQPLQCNQKYQFQIRYNNAHENAANILVLSKGKIIKTLQLDLDRNDDSVVKPDDTAYLVGTENQVQLPIVYQKDFDLEVTSEMSQKFSILVFYTREDNEVVADSLQVTATPCFQNKVSMEWNRVEAAPGSRIALTLKADAGSTCALSVVDKSVRLMASQNQVNKQKIIDSRATTHQSSQDEPRQIHERETCLISEKFGRKKRSLIYDRFFLRESQDAIFAFDEAGVVTVTDMNIATRCERMWSRRSHRRMMDFEYYDAIPLSAEPEVLYFDDSTVSSLETAIRHYFPETWIYDLEDISQDQTLRKKLNVPDTITEWVGTAYCTSPSTGLGISETSSITVFTPFFIDYTLPYSVKRGETFEFKVSVFSYVDQRSPVKVLLQPSLYFVIEDDHYERNFWLDPRKHEVIVFNITATSVGHLELITHAMTSTDNELEFGAENSTIVYHSDAVKKSVIVEPEGFPEEKSQSELMCVEGGNNVIKFMNCEASKDSVEDSTRAFLTVTGDLMGPVLTNLESLIRFPTGCGEQNMAKFVPNIHVLTYFEATKHNDKTMKNKCKEHMKEGYQRQLKYNHPDGSYSAFGSSGDKPGSLWLTAFVLKSFSQAKRYVFVDHKIVKKATRWIFSQQLENGCFPKVGELFNEGLQGGIQGEEVPTLLTAYVVIALLEAGVKPNERHLEDALHCLDVFGVPEKPYSMALAAYTWYLAYKKSEEEGLSDELVLARQINGNNLLNKLKQLSHVGYGKVWWEEEGCDACNTVNVETAAYAMMALMLGSPEEIGTVRGIAKWLIKQRNGNGGFYSTQDTVMALEALTKLALLTDEVPLDEVVIRSDASMDDKWTITQQNRLLTQVKEGMTEFSSDVSATGQGCVLVQCTVRYNILKTENVSVPFSMTVSSSSTSEECEETDVRVCVTYEGEKQRSNMVVVEVNLPSGYHPDTEKLDSLMNDVLVGLNRWEYVEKETKVNLYFDAIYKEAKCFTVTMKQQVVVRNILPAIVKMFDYYQPEYTISQMYEVCSEEPEDSYRSSLTTPTPTTESTHNYIERLRAMRRQRNSN